MIQNKLKAIDKIKKREQMRIDNQKQLEQVLRERDERSKARANKLNS